ATFNAGTFDGISVSEGSAVVNGGTCNLIRALYGNATIYGGEIYNTYIYNGSITVYGGTLGDEYKIDDKTQFGVNLPEDNTVAAEPQVTTKDSDVVLTVTPEEGNLVDSIVVKYRGDQTIIPVQDAENPLKYTFKMPKAPVEVVVNYKPAITITAASGSWVYDGQAHGNAEVTVTAGALKEGDTLAATASGSVTNVADTAQGNNPVAEGYKVMRAGVDVTAEYAITAAAGTLEIEPRAITITAASESWVYDGQAHGNAEVTVTQGGLAEGDALEAAATGSVTNVADTAQDNNPVAEGYKVTRGETDVTANYSITAVAGSLGITKAENPAVIAENASVTAGGEAIDLSACVTGAEGEVTYEITGDANGCTLEGSILTPGTAEGSCTVSVTVAGDDNRTGGAGRITVQISPAPQESEPEASSEAETTPEESIASSAAPQTGDAGTNPIVLALIAAVSLAGAAIVIRRRGAE
ncbi:MAG: LPXTG cell wall anchor domain-containing protein, partial [Clostridia bacterium]|nr:LPXTG cell wall anchor domain-containing protein [Clostridia bacterium]